MSSLRSRTSAPAATPSAHPAVTANTPFRPSATQRRFMQLAIAAQGPLRVAPLCEQLGISRSTYYRWLEQPGFRAWMSAQWMNRLIGEGGRLISIAQARAETDYRFFRFLADLVFDPRGLGLLTAWQQRMANRTTEGAVARPADPLFTEDPDEDTKLDADLVALESVSDNSDDDPPAAPPSSPEPASPAMMCEPANPVPHSGTMESISYAPATQHFSTGTCFTAAAHPALRRHVPPGSGRLDIVHRPPVRPSHACKCRSMVPNPPKTASRAAWSGRDRGGQRQKSVLAYVSPNRAESISVRLKNGPVRQRPASVGGTRAFGKSSSLLPCPSPRACGYR